MEIQLINKIKSIKQALEFECYLPALSLALTLPDICGQIEYPEMINKKGFSLVGKQYKTWFDNWVNHYYANNTGFINGGKQAKNPYFNGNMCYKLRCSYLHSGNSDIGDFGYKEDDKDRFTYHFELGINGADSFGTMWHKPQIDVDKISKVRNVRIDIKNLCENLCLSAEHFYKLKGKEHFIENKIEILDINRPPMRPFL